MCFSLRKLDQREMGTDDLLASETKCVYILLLSLLLLEDGMVLYKYEMAERRRQS